MVKVRCKETSAGSFFGNFLYDQKVGRDHCYQIERKFGESKKWHAFKRCRYTGYIRHAIQSYFTFMVLNLKRLAKLLTGIGFRSESRNSITRHWVGASMPFAWLKGQNELIRSQKRWLKLENSHSIS